MGFRVPAVALSPYARRGYVSHTRFGFESILKMIRYRFGLKPLKRRDAYARNFARAFDWESKPRLEPPELPDPAMVMSTACSAQGEGSSRRIPRPKEHDFEEMITTGWMERFGIEYRPWTPETTFRQPSDVKPR
jgi:phospholipase C